MKDIATAQWPETEMGPVIQVTGLSRTYAARSKKDEDFTAVNGISFDVHPGEVYGLLGTNGAGKTSSLEVLEGLAVPIAGQVRILGRDPLKDRAQLRPLLGIMLQSGGLPRELTVAETLRMWAGTCSTPRPIGEVLVDVDLSHRHSVRVGSLSGGEQRRLDLACALINDPCVIFLDEPTTGLDPEARNRTWELLEKLKARGVTMVLTTHYLEDAERLADRIAIMDAGSIAVEGRLGDVVAAEGAEINVSLPDISVFPDFPAAEVTICGHDVRIETPHLQADTARLLEWADARNITFSHFSAHPASLERVFQAVVGRASSRA